MKKQFTIRKLFIAAIGILMMVSCNKASVTYFDQPIPVPSGTPKLKEIIFASDTRTNHYDVQGRFVQATYGSGSKTDMIYAASTVVYNSYNAGGAVIQKENYLLNADGLIASSTNSNNLTSVFYYTYNSYKNLVYDTYVENGSLKRERFYQYSNGNLVKDSTREGSSWTTNEYEYFTDIISTIGNANYGTEVFGLTSINCLKKATTNSSFSPVKIKMYNIPKRDAAGRITEVSYSLNGAAPVVTNYTYY